MIQIPRGFNEEELTAGQVRHLRQLAQLARVDVLRMTHLAGLGNVGGSLSSIDLLITLLAVADLNPSEPEDPSRDRVVVSHGHIAPAVYAALGHLDFYDCDDAVSLFAKAGSVFEGTPDRAVTGVEWTSGELGMGLSAACGFAISSRLHDVKNHTFVLMSDGEQQKGQVAEARRFAKKCRLNSITALLDFNGAQVAGKTTEVMPQNMKYEYIADGWDVIEINGHDPNEIYKALRRAMQIQSAPVLVLARTTVGSGVSFLEGNGEYLRRVLTEAEYAEAMRELRAEPGLQAQTEYREAFGGFDLNLPDEQPEVPIPEVGEPVTYEADALASAHEAVGRVIAEVGSLNIDNPEAPVALVDCGSILSAGMETFAREYKDRYFQFGVQDHAAATTAGALSTAGVVTVWTGSAAHILDGAYGQLRVNDLNGANVKLVLTHLGVTGGRVAKALRCTDALGLVDNLPGCRAVFPADANQADRVLRFALTQPGTWVIGVDRTPGEAITGLDGRPVFGDGYRFEYGGIDVIRPGDHGVILTTGAMLARALTAWEILRDRNMEPTVIHVACPKTLDASHDPQLLQAMRKGRVITYEDHNVRTGLGSRAAQIIAVRGISCRLLPLGLDGHGSSGAPDGVLHYQGLDVETLVARGLKFLKK